MGAGVLLGMCSMAFHDKENVKQTSQNEKFYYIGKRHKGERNIKRNIIKRI